MWKICVEEPFMNCQKIYPIRQKKVKSIIEHVKRNPNIKSVVIFGSSVTSKCHVGSDVDLYIEMEKEEKPFTEGFQFVYDLWTNYTVDERLYHEIENKGVLVYGKGRQNAFDKSKTSV